MFRKSRTRLPAVLGAALVLLVAAAVVWDLRRDREAPEPVVAQVKPTATPHPTVAATSTPRPTPTPSPAPRVVVPPTATPTPETVITVRYQGTGRWTTEEGIVQVTGVLEAVDGEPAAARLTLWTEAGTVELSADLTDARPFQELLDEEGNATFATVAGDAFDTLLELAGQGRLVEVAYEEAEGSVKVLGILLIHPSTVPIGYEGATP